MMRYDERPFLRLLDGYVLRAIGELGLSEEAELTIMEPMLADIPGVSARWFDIVAARMRFADDMPLLIAELWEQEKANGSDLVPCVTPAEFTRLFVDVNFAA